MKQATLETIKEVIPHPNADRLELIQILGYQCVSEKGLHKAGDRVIYVQPDNILPDNLEWAEGFRKYAPSRIKAIRLRGEYSEGILVKPSAVGMADNFVMAHEDGTEWATDLGIVKYEPPLVDCGTAKAGLPFSIPKTDEERWENIPEHHIPFGATCDVTLKIDGTSTTFAYNHQTDEFFICGRTTTFQDNSDNKFAFINEKYGIEDKLRKTGLSLVIRGETYGTGIQGLKKNPHAKLPKDFACYSVYQIGQGYHRIGSPFYFSNLCKELDIPTVPIIEQSVKLTPGLIQHYSTGIEKLDGSYLEGVVINHERGSFKIINKYYDSKK